MSTLVRTLRGFAVPTFSAARPDAALGPVTPGRRTLRVYFIRPSTYGDDGHVLHFRWGVIPSNTLPVLAGLAAGYARQRSDLCVQTVLWDEMVDPPLSVALIDSIRGRAATDGTQLLIGLAGVQTSQWPRARDIALQCRAVGLPVVVGGFHVSSHAPSREFLASVGVTVVIGEAETLFDGLMDDAVHRRLRPSYAVTDGMRARTGSGTVLVPAIAAAELPQLDPRYLSRFFNPTLTTLDTSRGCPFTCSYCAVQQVMGRTVRARDPRRVVEWVRDAHDRHGIRTLFFVDDDLFRSPRWDEVLRGLARLRRERRDLWFMMQADIESAADAADATPRGRGRRFVDLAAEAGCYSVFIGFESLDPVNLAWTHKLHNAPQSDRHDPRSDTAAGERLLGRYRGAVDAWHRAGVSVHAGYMLGLPFDMPGCGRRGARALADIGVDLASFFVHTLLPGTEDYARAVAAGAITNHDFNEYDSMHYAGTHPVLAAREVEQEFRDAFRAFYSARRLAWSVGTAHRVHGLHLAARLGIAVQHLYFGYAVRRGWHPLLGGLGRRHDRATRRAVVTDAEAVARYGALQRPRPYEGGDQGEVEFAQPHAPLVPPS
jgi:radical SAM superfamily enzyme YgiQ (UPF0313 family)